MAGLQYTEEQMRPLIDRIIAGESMQSIIREKGIHRDTLNKYFLKLTGKRQQGQPKQPKLGWNLAIADKPFIAPISHNGGVVMAIPDIHSPFMHQDALAFCKAVKLKYQPTCIIQLGDEIDAHAFSDKFPHDPDGMTAGQELRAAIEALTPWYIEFPNVLICESNHTLRPFKLAFRAGLPEAFLPSYSKLLNAPDGWVWKTRHVVDNVIYMHGDAGRNGQYAHIAYMKALKSSVVIGHIHSYAGTNYEDTMFAANSGCLIDVNAYCFRYARNLVTKPNLGCTIVTQGKWAQFIPMLLNEHGRWIGTL